MQKYRRQFAWVVWFLLGLCLTLGWASQLIFPDAVRSSDRSSLTQTLPNATQQEQQGKERYDSGQFAEAANFWQQVAQFYQRQGDRLNQARVLSNLSSAYQQLGQWTQAQDAIAQSLQLLGGDRPLGGAERHRNLTPESLKILAQSLNTQGSLQLALGQAEQALTTYVKATATYAEAEDATGVTRSSINQAQAMRAMGLYRRALILLTQVKQDLQQQPNSTLKAAGLRSLGNSLNAVGDFDQSQQALQQSLAIAQSMDAASEMGATLLSLGNLARSRQDTPAALTFYQQAVAISPSEITKLQAELNQFSLLLDRPQDRTTQSLLAQIQARLVQLPPSQAATYARLNFARSLIKSGKIYLQPAEIAQILATAVQQARTLADRKAEAYSLGILGELYEKNQQWSNAKDLTQQALILAEAVNAPEIAYRWQWQLGRLLKNQGDIVGAIAAYKQAFDTLQVLRSDLVTVNPEIQFSFRESIEPVYREFVSLLLQPGNSEPDRSALIQARQAIESLQLAELDNFFREACLDIQPAQIDRVDPQTAVFYPIILADRLEVIFNLPNQPLRHYATPIPQAQVEELAEKLRRSLTIRSKRDFLPPAQQVYDWLIRPVKQDLADSGIHTLVFVLDGALRNLPMAVLHDGSQYLIEQYSLAIAPGLQLLAPKQLQRRNLRVLSAGLTEARQGFAPLDNVETELQEIKAEVPTEVLLNQAFTRTNLQDKLQSTTFPIVHIATHGQFSSKASETFILAWDGRIAVDQLDRLLQSTNFGNPQAIELLVFSACQTATGDKRAALGLAGVAVKAGARSTLATLWSVSDEATATLMGQFYRELTRTQESKAEALRQAQLTLLNDSQNRHPIYWAPYVLVGNWL